MCIPFTENWFQTPKKKRTQQPMSEVTDSLIEIEVQNGLRDLRNINKYESQRIMAKTPKSSCPDSSLCLTEFPSWHNIWTKMQGWPLFWICPELEILPVRTTIVYCKALQWNPSLSCKNSWPWKAACSCWATVQKMQVPWPCALTQVRSKAPAQVEPNPSTRPSESV